MWWKTISQDFFNENSENFFPEKNNISEKYSLKLFIYLWKNTAADYK